MSVKAPVTGVDWEQNLNAAIKLIQENDRFLFAASLDPDSVGSMLSLALYLRLIGKKKVFLVMKDQLGANFDFLHKIIVHNKIDVISSLPGLKKIKDEVDLVMFFDTPNARLLPFYKDISEVFLSRPMPVIETDHHFGADSEELSADSIKLYRKANANAEIVAEMLARTGEKRHVASTYQMLVEALESSAGQQQVYVLGRTYQTVQGQGHAADHGVGDLFLWQALSQVA